MSSEVPFFVGPYLILVHYFNIPKTFFLFSTSSQFTIFQFSIILNISHIYSLKLVENPRGVLRYKSDGGARRKISGTPLKGTRTFLWTCPKFITTSKRYQSSAPTTYITGTANFNSNKDNMIIFEHFLVKDVFERIVINLYTNQSF